MKKNKRIIILIVILITIEIIATYFMYKSSTNKEVKLDNVELKEIDSKNSLAIIMIETEEGEYSEYTKSTSWPEEYNFNNEKSICINERGEKVEGILTFDERENKAYVNDIKEGTYCYLYFDLLE